MGNYTLHGRLAHCPWQSGLDLEVCSSHSQGGARLTLPVSGRNTPWPLYRVHLPLVWSRYRCMRSLRLSSAFPDHTKVSSLDYGAVPRSTSALSSFQWLACSEITCGSSESHIFGPDNLADLSSYTRTYRPAPYHIVQEIQKFNLSDYRPRQEQ